MFQGGFKVVKGVERVLNGVLMPLGRGVKNVYGWFNVLKKTF